MLHELTRHWWVWTLRGAAAIVFGLLAVVWPGVTIAVLVILFGAYVLVDGVSLLVAAVRGGTRGPRWPLAAEAALSIGFGVVALLWPGLTAIALLLLIAAWAIVTGALRIAMAVRLRREIANEWLLVLSGVLAVLFGVVVAVAPGAGALALVWLIALYALIAGVAMIALSLRLRSLSRDSERV
ncbi:HdeD family acid-resistance protein [Allonocardiopsis opalescens]|uniref:Uncharacterized membrane protein HdeD (DUF308 family) n=1 Tax=Allonocardiopsis opalescens TaxID=1144618 RepID=A0A2T0Q9Q0_9ACTN|nr:HdeD family acid-resistance protein [Allonocardiopsis opalescens]PRY00567.1 uncharacterized membrane protein HdeD (DUF308 family) [Allonocardiopsis opalescens]